MLVLVAAYRTLGGPPPRPADAAPLLEVAAAALSESLADLSVVIDAAPSPPEADVVRRGRRSTSRLQGALDRVDSIDSVADADAQVRDELRGAADDLAWAWRIAAAGIGTTGIVAALTALRDHAEACGVSAAQLGGGPALGEPGDGA